MIRAVKIIAAFIVLALLTPNIVRATDDATFDISVKANSTKTNGSPWDGVPGLGNSKANLNAAPDIAVCVVRANTKPNCIWRPDGRRLFSLCQNAWTCKFPDVALTPPVALVFIDIDVRNHDIIDTVILAGNENAAADVQIADSLRAALSVLIPNRSEDTKERLTRGTKIIPLGDCAGKNPCRLGQSEFSLTPRK